MHIRSDIRWSVVMWWEWFGVVGTATSHAHVQERMEEEEGGWMRRNQSSNFTVNGRFLA